MFFVSGILRDFETSYTVRVTVCILFMFSPREGSKLGVSLQTIAQASKSILN